MKVNFNGKVLLGGSTKRLSLNSEIKQIKQYANQNDCDVLICNRDLTPDNIGVYHTIVVKESSYLGENYIFSKIFDFHSEKPEKSQWIKLDIPNA